MSRVQRAEFVVVKGVRVTRADVESAMAECDAMGQAAFLDHYGFKPAQRYWVRGPKHHRSYPSKAILAVAAQRTKRHGFSGNQLPFGGAAHTVSQLQRLGFEVREGDEVLGSVGLDALREQAIAAGFDDPCPEWDELPVTPICYFASGSNRVGEIRGLAAVKHDLGVAADYLKPDGEAELVKLAGSEINVFVDSGAFSEVKFNPERLAFDVVKPIGDTEWRRRLALYERLGVALGEACWVVAPDQVGSQEVTLERLARYAPELARIAATGCQVLVVAQKGAMTQADFYKAAVAAAGLESTPNVWPALPCKKAATTAKEVKAFLEAAQPEHVHLLGLGPARADAHGHQQRKVAEYVAPFAAEGCTASVSLDSCWIRSNAGRTNGKGKGRRRYTKAQDYAKGVLAGAGRFVSANMKHAADVALKVELALLLCLGAPLPTVVVPGQQLGLWTAA